PSTEESFEIPEDSSDLEGTSADVVRALKKFVLCRVSTEI
ncbi:hypothetical protein Tco_0439576, partial [Tanacetum coccineum]